MLEYISLWLGWFLFCFISFFMRRSVFRTSYIIGLLCIIIFFPYYFALDDFIFRMSHLFILLWCSIALIKLHFSWKHYTFVLLIAYLYTTYFLWRITSPILNDFSFLFIGLLCGILLIHWVKVAPHHKIYLWLSGISYGHLLLCLISSSYHLQNIRFDMHYYIFLFSIVFFLSIQNTWHHFLSKIETGVKILENKKRWNR